MAQMTASAFLLQRLVEWGVRRIYGYPGDGINGLIGALEAAGLVNKRTRKCHPEERA